MGFCLKIRKDIAVLDLILFGKRMCPFSSVWKESEDPEGEARIVARARKGGSESRKRKRKNPFATVYIAASHPRLHHLVML